MHRKLSVVLLEEELRDDYGHIFMFALVVSHCKHNDDALPPLTGKDNTVLTNKFNGNELNYSVQRFICLLMDFNVVNSVRDPLVK